METDFPVLKPSRRYPPNFNKSRMRHQHKAGEVLSGAYAPANMGHAPCAGCCRSQFTLKGADPVGYGRSLSEMGPAIVVARRMIGPHQRMLVSGVFFVDIQGQSPAGCGHASARPQVFLVQSTMAATSRRSSRVESMAEIDGSRSLGSLPAEFLLDEVVWRQAAPAFMQFIIFLRAAVLPPPFC